jgi:hypothetical protein
VCVCVCVCVCDKFHYLLCKEGSRNDLLDSPKTCHKPVRTGGGPRFSALAPSQHGLNVSDLSY